jgi:hypothetical protein
MDTDGHGWTRMDMDISRKRAQRAHSKIGRLNPATPGPRPMSFAAAPPRVIRQVLSRWMSCFVVICRILSLCRPVFQARTKSEVRNAKAKCSNTSPKTKNHSCPSPIFSFNAPGDRAMGNVSATKLTMSKNAAQNTFPAARATFIV